jgi:O-methyltransferase involved in polyketide biosynthesis
MEQNTQNNQNLTIWQRLSQTFGPNSLLNQDYPTFRYDKKELLKTTNKQEFEKQKLQAQQTVYLAQQWTKIENNLYTQGVYFEPTRLASYYDYESMEYTPEISAALDIYAEESTTVNQNGFIYKYIQNQNVLNQY